MKTLKQLYEDIRAINAEFRAHPDELLDKPGFLRAERKFLREIRKAEVALASYRPETPEQFVEKVTYLFLLQDVKDAFSITPATRAWHKSMLGDLTVLVPTPARKAA